MLNSDSSNFLAGVIEGFYGQPWTPAERLQLFDRMAAWGLNTYLYAPKDDLKHRAIWRVPYSAEEIGILRSLAGECQRRGLRFIYALSPGLDIRYSKESDRNQLCARFQQLIEIGCESFALLFDDIPDRLEASDIQQWGSLAAAQCHLSNTVFGWLRERKPAARFLFCPTPYCGRMAGAHLGGSGYLSSIGQGLHPQIDVCWTGPEIISREITPEHVQELRGVLRRKPLIWDNLFANDYDGRRFYCGPYSGRTSELNDHVAGLLINPNNEFPLNFVPMRTLAQFVTGVGSWQPREAYLAALREWMEQFAVTGEPLRFEDFVLFADCFYLPYEEGAEAAALFHLARKVLLMKPVDWGSEARQLHGLVLRLRQLCADLANLIDRPLFNALFRRVWELREEMDLLDRYLGFHLAHPDPPGEFRSDFHLAETYRGGLVARLQGLLLQRPDGTFVPTDCPELLSDGARRVQS